MVVSSNSYHETYLKECAISVMKGLYLLPNQLSNLKLKLLEINIERRKNLSLDLLFLIVI
ncbi:hypothetical protein OCHUTO_0268 [Orientia chuto str. Dubai]|uniref:Uncharacterized protein n=1 Tax=Orientia chuto str. Dubai TaxID=1359168 RepID=A0A0F3MM78_9RICK|nr:hypothetical protein [Candidatus Orientia mediorientalis]KJV56883.1 hypothetical protein OCHUTO_0268 [Orientia chuto str. Dubai]